MRPLKVWLKAGHTVRIIEQLLPQFSRQTGIDVELTVAPEGEAHDGLVSGSTQPDVVTAPFWTLNEFLERGILTPVPLMEPGFNDLFVPLAIDALTRDGTLYAVPHTLTGGVLSYRKDLLEAVGLDVPRGLEDVITADRLLRGAGRGGLVARADAEFSSLETYAGWSAGRGLTLLPDRGEVDLQTLRDGVGDLVASLRYEGSELAKRNYAAVGELVVEGRAALLFDTSAWSFRFEAHDSPVRGRMGYTVLAETAPAQFMYAEGLAVTTWCEIPEAAWSFIQWRHSEYVIRAEVEQVGRIDLPRLDIRDSSWFIDYVREHRLMRCLDALDASWSAGSTAHVAQRADYVVAARQAMGVISGVIAGRFGSFDEALALTAPTGPQA